MDWPTKTVHANGLDIAYAEEGEGPLVVLCHGWPELSFSWRRQLPALAAAGYRAVAPDMRGYGGTSAPDSIDAYTIFDLVGDMVALVDALGESHAVVVGHDWGAAVAWHCALLRPDIFRAVAGLSVPFAWRSAAAPLTLIKAAGLDTFYWLYFQTPGVAEGEFARDWSFALRAILYGSGLRLTLAPGAGLLDGAHVPPSPPAWLREDEIAFYIETFERTGLRGGLNWYRNLDRNWALTAPWRGARISQPALFIAGARDPVITGVIGGPRLTAMENALPDLRGKIILPHAGHWIQQEESEAVNAALITFLRSLDGAAPPREG